MDKITQALKKILPAEHVSEVSSAIQEILAEKYEQLESEFQSKLDSSYTKILEEKESVVAETYRGYQQAYEIISSLMNRLDEQKNEFESTMEEGFEEAFKDVEAEKAKRKNIELELYEEYDNKLKEIKNLFVEKLDQFLSLQESEIYEAAKRDVLADPRISEQRIAVEKMAELLSDYMSVDDVAGYSAAKFEEAQKQIESLRGQVRLLESKNVNLSLRTNRLTSKLEESNKSLTEATKVERKNRMNRKENVSGRGQRVLNEQQIIREFENTNNSQAVNDRELSEANDPLNDLLVLSGLTESR